MAETIDFINIFVEVTFEIATKARGYTCSYIFPQVVLIFLIDFILYLVSIDIIDNF